jgi:hypothetical protein
MLGGYLILKIATWVGYLKKLERKNRIVIYLIFQ